MQFFVWLAVQIAAAYLISALQPRPKKPEPQKANIPIAEQGRGIIWVFGDVWITDSQMLGYREDGTIPIKAGGKK